MSRPFAWEKSYPPGVSWDAPIGVSTVSALLDEGLARSADRAVFDFRDRAISYRELAQKVDRLAAAFLDRGIGPGSAVGLYLPNTPYHPIAFFACMKAGIRAVHMSALGADPARAAAAPRRRRDHRRPDQQCRRRLRGAARRRRRCRAAAIHRRHDRPAERRAADACE